MGFIFPQIEAFEQPAELLQTDGSGELVGVLWPDEFVALQALLPQAEAVAMPVQRLDLVARSIGKNVQSAGKRAQAQFQLHEHRKTIYALSEINGLATQVDLIEGAAWVHQCST